LTFIELNIYGLHNGYFLFNSKIQKWNGFINKGSFYFGVTRGTTQLMAPQILASKWHSRTGQIDNDQ
jgi:hypothetical protein